MMETKCQVNINQCISNNFAHSPAFSAYYRVYNESQRRSALLLRVCVCVHMLDLADWLAAPSAFLPNLPL